MEDYRSGRVYNWQRDNLMRNMAPGKSAQKTKRRSWNSDIDSIDSVLFLGMYPSIDDPGEEGVNTDAEIRSKTGKNRRRAPHLE